MFEGTKVLFRFAMGILRMNEEQILQRNGTGPLFQFLRNMTSRLYNVNELAKVRLSGGQVAARYLWILLFVG